jgi:hypothetical protein
VGHIRELGATPIDYQREDFTRVLPGGFDVVFDGIAQDGYRRSFAALKRGGLLCAYGTPRLSLSCSLPCPCGLARRGAGDDNPAACGRRRETTRTAGTARPRAGPERHDHLGGDFGILSKIGIDSRVLDPASIQANRRARDPLSAGARGWAQPTFLLHSRFEATQLLTLTAPEMTVLVGGLRVRRQTDGISSKVKFAPDSPQEGNGFEPSVPVRQAVAIARAAGFRMLVMRRIPHAAIVF